MIIIGVNAKINALSCPSAASIVTINAPRSHRPHFDCATSLPRREKKKCDVTDTAPFFLCLAISHAHVLLIPLPLRYYIVLEPGVFIPRMLYSLKGRGGCNISDERLYSPCYLHMVYYIHASSQFVAAAVLSPRILVLMQRCFSKHII